MPDQQRIAEITTRCEAATPGPWRQAINYSWGKKLNVEPNVCFCQEECNAAFIAHASDDIPYLLTQLAEREREIERLREAQRWIEAEDRLPDIGDVCLCRIEHNYTDDGWSAYRVYEYGGEGCWLTMGNLCFVTHWMPLPAPPEKGE